MIQVSRITLPNGLRVVHAPMSSTAMAAVTVLYDVGARYENPDHTGLAHLMEHLMFAGSANVADYSRSLENAGGQDNAWTSNDFTCYFDIVPASNIETAFHLESDRMLSPFCFGGACGDPEVPLQVQRSVVIEEFKQQVINQPYGQLGHKLRELLYTTHPYRWPVIGLEEEHVAKTTLEDVRRFVTSHYGPDNAILAVAGNVDFDTVCALARKWFGDIPARNIPERTLAEEPPVEEERRATVVGPVPQPMIVLAWHIPGYGKPGYREADIISDLLAAGKASRLYRRLLVGTDLFTDVDASISGSEETGFLSVRARLTPGADLAHAEELLLQESLRIADDGEVDPHELERLGNRYESTATLRYMSVLELSQALALAEYHGEDINADVDRYRAITPAQVQEAARSIFSHPPCVIHYLPEE